MSIDIHDLPLSPAEVAYDMLDRYGSTIGAEIPDKDTLVTAIVGPANDTQQQGGCISFMGAGLPVIEKYTPIQWHRAQARCLAGDLATADYISSLVQRDMHDKQRLLCYQASNDSWYLVHLSNVVAGPSMHFDSAETWETLLFAELMIGNDPVATGSDFPTFS